MISFKPQPATMPIYSFSEIFDRQNCLANKVLQPMKDPYVGINTPDPSIRCIVSSDYRHLIVMLDPVSMSSPTATIAPHLITVFDNKDYTGNWIQRNFTIVDGDRIEITNDD